MDEIVADGRFGLIFQLSLKEALQKCRRAAFDFGPRQRQHLEGLHPAGETVGDPWQGQHIRRAREEKPARTIILVDRLLDRQKQVGSALDLVDDGPVEAPDETGRIGLGSLEDGLIVERDIVSTGFPHLLDERGLAGPARSYDQHHGRIRKGFLRPALYKPFEHLIPESPDNWNYPLRLIGSQQSANWKLIMRDLESPGGEGLPLRPSL